ncbi:hypothetical protein HZP71_02155 [Elizabethkingia anophelis]|nr:hypothetical protein [Elizabethkingia anophelis]MCT3679014.1 hypothetical protein [Elizabethkingia anophelis]MCT4121445.1 hypothetical protein [Elizabethkingia anophelis]
MFNNQKSATKGSKSTSVAQSKFNFVRTNEGRVSSDLLSPGIFKCIFSSEKTGRSAFAFGPTFEAAYENMIRKFNIKYAS